MGKVVITSAARSAIGNFGGALRTVPAYDLAAPILNEVVKRSKLEPKDINVVIMAQNYQSGEYVNIARMSLLKAGWPVEAVGFTIDRRCPGGLDAITFATMMIQTGNAEIMVAGGVESMSTTEMYLKGDIRWQMGGTGDMPKGHGSLATWSIPLYDRMMRGRVMSQPEERFGVLQSMMTWAETAAKEHGLTREEVDKWALLSNQRACSAIETGKFKEEIVPVPVPQGKGEPVMFSVDERPRKDSTLESLAKLRPVQGGVCTAANSSGENDGAAACVLMSEEKAKSLGLKPIASVKGFAYSGADPRFAWKSVTEAVNLALKKTGLTLDKIDLIEIHEAFAAQTLANMKELGLTEKDRERINVNGSCVALGHPLGATGTRIFTTLAYEMQRSNAKNGMIAICGGGGMGVCAIFEKA
ncbi:MAG: thiolase family protein [Dehalococcoidia bacterium]|nr:thiolase family protein [Dehalococcoidia bacterium]